MARSYLIVTGIIAFIGGLYWLFMSSYSQLFGRYPYRVKTKQKIVALTLDDGPNEPYTSAVLDYLNTKNVKATFFLVGKCIQRHPNLPKRMIAEGHVIGNHSLSHAFHNYFVSPSFAHEITANQTIIKDVTGRTPALYRSPWLWRQPWLLKTARRQHLRPVSGVFCHAFEVLQLSGQRIAKRAIAKTKPGTILIFHDGVEGRGGNRQQTVEAIKLTVDALLQQGYHFVTVDELLGIPAYQA